MFDALVAKFEAKFDAMGAKFDVMGAKFDVMDAKFEAKFDTSRDDIISSENIIHLHLDGLEYSLPTTRPAGIKDTNLS